MKRSAVGAALLLLSCSSAPSDCSVAAERQAVIGGRESMTADDGVVVVVIQRPRAASVCSGALIAPNLLVTARHCITSEYTEDNIRCRGDATLVMPSGGLLGEPVAAERVTIYLGVDPSKDGISGLPGGAPSAIGAQILTTDWPNVCRDDVALVVLDRQVAAPVLAVDLTTNVTKATRISAIGYGLTEGSATGALWATRKRRDGIAVKYIDSLPGTFGVGRSVCQGDSGGPALDSLSGGILGVYSLGFPGVDLRDCTSENALNHYARLSEYEPLLREAFAAAEQPFPEPTTGAGGAPSGEAGALVSAAAPNDGGAGGATEHEEPTSKPSASDDSGCTVAHAQAGRSSLVATLAALFALGRRRRYSVKGFL